MDAPGDTTPNPLRTALRRLVLGVFFCAVALIVLLVGIAALSVAGSSFDPHGYAMLFGILLAAVLTPVALALWVSYRWLQDRPTTP